VVDCPRDEIVTLVIYRIAKLPREIQYRLL